MFAHESRDDSSIIGKNKEKHLLSMEREQFVRAVESLKVYGWMDNDDREEFAHVS